MSFKVYPCCSRCQFPSLFRLNDSIVYVDHIVFMQSSIDGHLDCLFIIMLLLPWCAVALKPCFQFFGVTWSFCFRTYRAVFHTGCTILQFHQQCTDSSCLCPCQYLLFAVFLRVSILKGVEILQRCSMKCFEAAVSIIFWCKLLFFLSCFHWNDNLSCHSLLKTDNEKFRTSE